MRIRLRLDGRRPRAWHAALIDRLAARTDRPVEVDAQPCTDEWPSEAETLLRIEAFAYGLPRNGPASRLTDAAVAAWSRPSETDPDLIIDLVGDVAPSSVPLVRLLFDGLPGESALLSALLAKRVPVASLAGNGRTLCAARLGTEVRGVVLTMLDDAFARTVSMIDASFAGGAMPFAGFDASPIAELSPVRTDLARRSLRIAANGVLKRLYRLGYHSPHWRIGWRRLDGPDLAALGRHPDNGWRELPDDGRRFYADPFPLVVDGRCWLFVEEFPHATGKGVISAVPFDRNGPLGTPEPVLELPYHLSYPFVFERDGAVWMIPEACAGETIDLYRARSFPGGWVKESTLVEGVTASDATLLERDGTWWMFATVREAPADAPLGHGSFSDALYLWNAPDFRGPWTAHRANPVLIDIATARPAGRIVVRDGEAIRPVQDCAEGYGRALALMRIDRLDEGGFVQSPVARITAGPLWPGTRIHSLNSAGGFEFIDGSARVPRFLPPGLARRQV